MIKGWLLDQDRATHVSDCCVKQSEILHRYTGWICCWSAETALALGKDISGSEAQHLVIGRLSHN